MTKGLVLIRIVALHIILKGDFMKKVFFVLACMLGVVTSIAKPDDLAKLQTENAALQQQIAGLKKENDLLIEENKSLKSKLENMSSQQNEPNLIAHNKDANSSPQDPPSTLVLKDKILTLHQKKAKLEDLKSEIKSIKPTMLLSTGKLVTTNKYGETYYRKNDPLERTNPEYTAQKTKIYAMEKSIAQLEKDILLMNELRVKKGYLPIQVSDDTTAETHKKHTGKKSE